MMTKVITWKTMGQEFLSSNAVLSFCFRKKAASICSDLLLALSSLTCKRTAPILLSLASVSRMKGLVKLGKVKIGVDVNLWCSFSNAAWQASIQLNFGFLSSSQPFTAAMFSKWQIHWLHSLSLAYVSGNTNGFFTIAYLCS